MDLKLIDNERHTSEFYSGFCSKELDLIVKI